MQSRLARRSLAPLVLLWSVPVLAEAQTPARDDARLPAGFVGIGAGPSTNDASSRMRLFEDGLAYVWFVEGGAAVSRRFGVGLEYSRPNPATAFTTAGAGRSQFSGRQSEWNLLALARVRVAGTSRIAADVVGGAGMMFQHHQMGVCDPAVPRCENTDGPALDHWAPAFAAGLDVPVSVAPHFTIGAAARVYFLRRSTHVTGDGLFLPWQHEWRPSVRTAIVLDARLTW